jgi:lambda repressor-like predicted transcriptional regulator
MASTSFPKTSQKKTKASWPPATILARVKKLGTNLNVHSAHQGCQIFLGTKYQNGEKYTK